MLQAGKRFFSPARSICTPLANRSRNSHQSHDAGADSEGLIESAQNIHTPIHHPHPPFDLSSQSYQCSSLYPTARPKRTAAQPRLRPISEGVMARLYSSSGNVEKLLKSIISDEQAAPTTKKKNKPRKKMARIKKKPPKMRETSNIFTPLREGGVEVEQPHRLQKNKSANLLSCDSEWKGEDWKENWGDDTLKPPSNSVKYKIRPSPPHFRRAPIPYTRRIEGLLGAADEPLLTDLPSISGHKPIAKLAHGLDRVLFNPGVHWLQDPRSRVYNFSPWLENIPKVSDFAFERLTGFIKSSRDEDLWALAKRENRTFAGSTSSLTGMLSQIYFLISGDKDVDISALSQNFRNEPRNFTPGQRMPSSIVMNYKDGVYAIDSASDQAGKAEKNILTWMGTLLEKYLTMTPDEFNTFMRASPPPDESLDPMREPYRYAKSSRFVMRSQLDCHDSRLPGTGVFDIKTRACLPIRLDVLNYEENSGYLIRFQHGLLESFEREYYDLIRSAFLKYSFQARIGNMDGVIVAYHNTARMFGFQYIPLEEMDERLFGPGTGLGDRVFQKCIGMLETVTDEIIRCFPDQSVQCTFETEEDKDFMNVWVEPVNWTSTGDEVKPIRQLEVTTSSYLGNERVRRAHAVSSTDHPWTIHWTVSQLSTDDDVVRRKLAAAKERQFRAFNLPTGVTIEQMAEFWNSLNFGGNTPEVPAAYDPDNFRKASKIVESLRSIARAGKEETARLELEAAGKPKIVLGEPESLSDEEIEAFSDGSLVVDEEPDVDTSVTRAVELPVVAVADDVGGVTSLWPEDDVERAMDDQRPLDDLDAVRVEDIFERGTQDGDISTSFDNLGNQATPSHRFQSTSVSSHELAEIDDMDTTEETQSAPPSINSVEFLTEERPSSVEQLSATELEPISNEVALEGAQSSPFEAQAELRHAPTDSADILKDPSVESFTSKVPPDGVDRCLTQPSSEHLPDSSSKN